MSKRDVAQRQLKTFQWDKVSPHGLASTIWARDGAAQDPQIADLLRQQGIFDAMEEDFRAKQTVKLAVERKKADLTSCLDVRQRQNIGASSLSVLVSLARL